MKRKVIIFILFQFNLSNVFYVNYWSIMTLELWVITKKQVFTRTLLQWHNFQIFHYSDQFPDV